MKKLLWRILLFLSYDNWGYSTPLQQRFKKGDKCKISMFKYIDTKFNINEEVTILESGRHDYLVENKDGQRGIVYQFELK